ncbi:methionine--tRNA ligase [Candidatus Kaiserbacteria bacterium]|nr:methionine--tRNA ligase [Candidatus Kaiserbacteria bacterium]
MSKAFYVTTTLPYVNADPHVGHALELVHADIFARYSRLMGREVFFNTGTDEHGLKVYRKALEENKEPQEYADEYALHFQNLVGKLGLIEDINFVRTTDPVHKKAAQEFWKRCDDNGYIYKKDYKIKYCVGCELEKTDSELEKGCCPLHPNLPIEIIEEENYFFKFSQFREKLLALYNNRPDFVVPRQRFNEIRSFVERGLEDFSISRLSSKMPWGIPVPGDNSQVMYVWFDALVNYISVIGWPDNMKRFSKWWPALQFAGKDQIRQQSAMWQAMLMAVGISEPSRQIIIHGFITNDGEKMSKSLGNVVNPIPLIDEYGVDAVRYYLARHTHPFEDSNFTMEKFKEAYNANLVNGLGNLVARIMKLAEDNLEQPIKKPKPVSFPKEYTNAIESFEFNRAIDFVWHKIQTLDERIAKEEPFRLVKNEPEKGKRIIVELATELYWVGRMLYPFLPDTNIKIKKTILANKKPENLFPRIL